VKLIEKNPITHLTKNYEDKLINKIKTAFTNIEQQLFVSSFFCYLNYDCEKDFIIDLNDVWKWIGFTRKDSAKKLLEKYFIEKKDYKILLRQMAEQDLENKKEHGGHNKEQIMLTVDTFKKFCLKANTKKSDEIHNYYIKLEKILNETINEQTDELRIQL
jgi:phage anti-repressor protein